MIMEQQQQQANTGAMATVAETSTRKGRGGVLNRYTAKEIKEIKKAKNLSNGERAIYLQNLADQWNRPYNGVLQAFQRNTKRKTYHGSTKNKRKYTRRVIPAPANKPPFGSAPSVMVATANIALPGPVTAGSIIDALTNAGVQGIKSIEYDMAGKMIHIKL